MAKLSAANKAAAKNAAEERSALEFQEGYNSALAGKTPDRDSLVYFAGRVAGTKERKKRNA